MFKKNLQRVICNFVDIKQETTLYYISIIFPKGAIYPDTPIFDKTV